MKRLIIFILLTVSLVAGCGQSSGPDSVDFAIRFNDEYTVSEEEYRVYLHETQESFAELGGEDIWETDFDGKTAEEVTAENTFAAIEMVKVSCLKAEKLGITLDEEDILTAHREADRLYNNLDEEEKAKIGADEDLYRKVMEDNVLYTKVFDEVVKDYVVNDEDFESYYAENRDDILLSFGGSDMEEDAIRAYVYERYAMYEKQTYFSKEFKKWERDTKIENNIDYDNVPLLVSGV